MKCKCCNDDYMEIITDGKGNYEFLCDCGHNGIINSGDKQEDREVIN